MCYYNHGAEVLQMQVRLRSHTVCYNHGAEVLQIATSEIEITHCVL